MVSLRSKKKKNIFMQKRSLVVTQREPVDEEEKIDDSIQLLIRLVPNFEIIDSVSQITIVPLS